MKPPIVEVTYNQTIETIEVPPEVAGRIAVMVEEIQAAMLGAMLVSGIAAKSVSFDSATGSVKERIVPAERLFGIIRTDVT